MKLNNMRPAKGSRHKSKRLGCGRASGHGASCTKGMKGQRSRSGGTKSPWFEGGQIPLLRRIPKRGFTNSDFRVDYNCVNVSQLENRFNSGEEINPEILVKKGIINRKDLLLKILGDGEIKKNLKVKAHKFSKSATKKITEAGGTAEELR
ncbi:MAG: 50S ribosomal protein L15 [Elusimicrobia bacterium RIFOXYA2_FULL_39_19]|nr:MAG: 50S ribosomal protein L15 [Elusimicrobia bacterium RIFOXYA2_FULL_39_19]